MRWGNISTRLKNETLIQLAYDYRVIQVLRNIFDEKGVGWSKSQ